MTLLIWTEWKVSEKMLSSHCIVKLIFGKARTILDHVGKTQAYFGKSELFTATATVCFQIFWDVYLEKMAMN